MDRSIMNKTVPIFISIIFYLSLTLNSLAQDEPTKPVGLARFNIYPIDLPGRIEDCVPLDLNQDGLTDLLITHVIQKSGKPFSNRTVSVIFHRPNTGLSDKSLQSWVVPSEALVLACGDYVKEVPGIEIGYLAPDGFYIYSLDNPSSYNLSPKRLMEATPLFNVPDEDNISVWQIPVDFDNNGTDDLIIPEQNGYRIYFQSVLSPVQFTPVKIETAFRKIVCRENTSWLTFTNYLPSIKIIDVNKDGLKDLVSFEEGSLIYYVQRPHYQFIKQSFELPYLKDILAQEISTASIVFSDINEDGLIDFVICALGGEVTNLAKLITHCFVYLAQPEPNKVGGLSYAPSPTQIINLKGISPLMELGDVNNDGKMDLVLASFQTDFVSNIKKALLRYIRVHYQLHLFQPDKKRFSVAPDYEQTNNLPFELVGKGQKYFSHYYLKYDFNNDGRSDLLTLCGPDKKRGFLSIRPGRFSEELLNKKGVGFKKDEYLLYPVRIPQQLMVTDFNNDKRPDLILLYKSNLITLISK